MWLLAGAVLAACGKKDEAVAPAAAVSAAPPPVQPAAAAKAPDFGGVVTVVRDVEAVGSTQELAVLSALQSAVAQVNGVRVASRMQDVRAALTTRASDRTSASVTAEGFARQVMAASEGAVTGYEILSQEEIDKVDEQTIARVRASDGGFSYSASASSKRSASAEAQSSGSITESRGQASLSGAASANMSSNDKASVDVQRGPSSYESELSHQRMRSYWKVRARVNVAQYKAPEESGRPKIVVAMPKTKAAVYVVGDGQTSAAEVASAVRGRLSDILTQTRRFVVLDREFGSDMQAEIDHINSGNVRVQDAARLGQQFATDLILVPVIERFEYKRSVRQLRMSDRQLVSYSGGGRITLRLLNAATGEVVMSDSFDHELAAADPSTMPRIIDGAAMAAEMMSTLSGRIGSAIVTEIFPITVVALSGDQVVLSQGGESLQAGQRWQAVYLGEELKDPQTGRSLGRTETPVGTVRVDRVSNQTSYGTLEDVAGLQGRPFTAGSIVLKQKASGTSGQTPQRTAATATATASAAGSAAAKPQREPRAAAPKADAAPASTTPSRSGAGDDKW